MGRDRRQRPRQFLAVLVALAVVLVAVAGTPTAPVQRASATHTGPCDWTDAFLYGLTFTLFNSHKCDPVALSDALDELEADQQNSTKTQIYNTGKQVQTDSVQYGAVVDNYLADSGNPAMAKAEAAAIAAIDANKTRTETETAAANAVQDYYTVKQMNLVDQWGTSVSSVATMENTSDVAALTEGFVEPNMAPASNVQSRFGFAVDEGITDSGYSESPLTTSAQTTLINGSTYNTMELRLAMYYQACNCWYNENARVDRGWVNRTIGGSNNNVSGVYVGPITGETSYVAFDFVTYGQRWANIEAKSTQLEANAQEYASALYNASEAGNLSTVDYVNGATLAQEYSTDYTSTGYYSYAVGWAATAGFAIPDLGNTSAMTIDTAGATYQGLLMSQTAPSGGTWQTGVTYDANLIGGKQFVATLDGSVVELTGEFTITSMEDEDGASITETQVQQTDYTVANTSAEYEALQQEIRSLQTEIVEDTQTTGGGGGASGSGFLGLGTTELLIVAVALGGLVLLNARE